jgi:peptidoglycan-associated lipoprotein
MKHSRELILISTAVLAMAAAGCSKKVAAQKPSTPVAPQETTQTPTPSGNRGAVANNNSGGVSGNGAATPSTISREPDAPTRQRIDQLLAKIEDAFFDYNKHELRPDAITALQADSGELRDIIVQYPSYKLVIEGHADERGSEAYNLALGDARSKSARDYLAQVGIPADQLTVVSYGKDKPVCDEHDEACWQKNRRVHIVAAAK